MGLPQFTCEPWRHRIEEVKQAGIFCMSAPRLYNEDLGQLEIEFGLVLETVVQDDWQEMARKKFGGAKKIQVWVYMTVRVWKIRCQDTTSEDRES
jgi:hypothetical protein